MSARRISDKETRELVARIEIAGGSVQWSSRGSHLKIFNQSGRYVATIGGTPSDYRARLNDIAAIRRGGLAI